MLAGFDLNHSKTKYPLLGKHAQVPCVACHVNGDFSGLALIKNAVNQGRDCVDTIVARLGARKAAAASSDVHDVLIVGAGPRG